MAAIEGRARHAALALHALNDADRHHVLAMLDTAQRERIEPMLAELRELGIPPGLSPAQAEPALRPKERTAIERVAALNADSVVPALASLSPAAIAVLLKVADWPWAEQALSGLSGSQRTAVRTRYDSAVRPAARMGEALCRAFEATVQRGETAPTSRPSASRWSAWWPRKH